MTMIAIHRTKMEAATVEGDQDHRFWYSEHPEPIKIMNISTVASRINNGTFLSSEIVFLNSRGLLCSSSRCSLPGLILQEINELASHRIMISVANLVHKFSFFEKGISKITSRRFS